MKRVLLTALIWPSLAFAEASGPELLARVDRAMSSFEDAVFELKLVMREKNGESRQYAFTTWQKPPDKRLVRFSAPGDVAGMGVLISDKDTMYVYLPGFQRVRRMGTHVKNQSFMGSNFSFEDMAEVAYAHSYDATLAGSDEKNWILDLVAKRGLDLEFPRLRIWADKTMFQPSKLEYYDAAGKKIRTQLRLGYTRSSARYWQPGKVVLIDHRRGDHASEILFAPAKIDSGIPDELFSVRSLSRGP